MFLTHHTIHQSNSWEMWVENPSIHFFWSAHSKRVISDIFIASLFGKTIHLPLDDNYLPNVFLKKTIWKAVTISHSSWYINRKQIFDYQTSLRDADIYQHFYLSLHAHCAFVEFFFFLVCFQFTFVYCSNLSLCSFSGNWTINAAVHRIRTIRLLLKQ